MTRPSVGKAGTDGKFVVEVVQADTGTRSFARRFVTQAEAEDFYARTVTVQQVKADREWKSVVVAVYETATPKSTEIFKEINSTHVEPGRRAAI